MLPQPHLRRERATLSGAPGRSISGRGGPTPRAPCPSESRAPGTEFNEHCRRRCSRGSRCSTSRGRQSSSNSEPRGPTSERTSGRLQASGPPLPNTRVPPSVARPRCELRRRGHFGRLCPVAPGLRFKAPEGSELKAGARPYSATSHLFARTACTCDVRLRRAGARARRPPSRTHAPVRAARPSLRACARALSARARFCRACAHARAPPVRARARTRARAPSTKCIKSDRPLLTTPSTAPSFAHVQSDPWPLRGSESPPPKAAPPPARAQGPGACPTSRAGRCVRGGRTRSRSRWCMRP